jgi:predicted component of type VI protein secretion system
MYNFNTTGGEPSSYTISNYTAVINAGDVKLMGSVVNARSWENHRGK